MDSFDSDEELSVGEEGSLKIDWEGWLLHKFYRVDLWVRACCIARRPYSASCGSVAEENSRDVPQGGVDEIGEEEVEVDVETADVEGG